jgi:radical SAM protein with 4Fe4S-binding SPASM domain
MNDILTVIKPKENQTGELIVALFEYCNLSCQMCEQNHNDLTEIDNVLKKLPSIIKSIDALKNSGKVAISVNFMGGELLADAVPDKVFDDYVTLISAVKEYIASVSLTASLHIVTNLVWEKIDRVKTLINKTNTTLMVSYDPAGRFNFSTFEVFKKNVVEFKEHIIQIGSVMTNPSMKKFMDQSVPFFDYLYDNFKIVFDHYTPVTFALDNTKLVKSTDLLMPTDIELRDFHKFMIDNWPNCYPFRDFSIKDEQPMSCMSTVTVLPTSAIHSCTVYDIKDKAKENTIVFFGKLEDHKKKWLDDYDCLSCPYMQRCSFGCFLNHHNSNIRTQETCWLQEVYDYVEEKC